MAVKPIDVYRKSITGNGLIHPLRRLASNDFETAIGEKLVGASVTQVLGTRPGELPWRPEFGLDLEKYRHANMTEAKAMQLGELIASTVSAYEPRASVTLVETAVEDTKVFIKIGWSLRSTSGSANILLSPVAQEVQV